MVVGGAMFMGLFAYIYVPSLPAGGAEKDCRMLCTIPCSRKGMKMVNFKHISAFPRVMSYAAGLLQRNHHRSIAPPR